MRKNERESEAGRQLYLESKVQNSSRRLSSSSCSRAIFLVCSFSMFQYCVKDQWRTLSIKRCPFSLFLPNVSFCCQDEKDINDLLEECRCGGKYQYIIQRTEREREGDRYKGACFYSVYNSFFIFEKKLPEILWHPGLTHLRRNLWFVVIIQSMVLDQFQPCAQLVL